MQLDSQRMQYIVICVLKGRLWEKSVYYWDQEEDEVSTCSGWKEAVNLNWQVSAQQSHKIVKVKKWSTCSVGISHLPGWWYCKQ